MKTEELIPIRQFCQYHEIEFSFIDQLCEYELIEITTHKETKCILKDHISEIEKMIHLYYDLNINMEGIDAIRHLLSRINRMNDEIMGLKDRLEVFED